jgi:uncharacterized protein YqeY
MDATDNPADDYKDRINRDLKTALLAGDKDKVMVLRGLKSAILYVEVAKGARDSGLPDDEVLAILTKEAKKRQESADLYMQGGSPERAASELVEKSVIEHYLPEQLSVSQVDNLIDTVVAQNGTLSKETMGATIAAVKQKSAGAADGAVIARLVRGRLDQLNVPGEMDTPGGRQ